jgi:hypothetical protein
MSINYEHLRFLVKEAMFTGGGINEPSAPEGVPHRMPAADTDQKEQDMGDPEANKLYDLALKAREATEKLIEALDDPMYDGPYENAFKATTALRKVLNDIEGLGAHPMPTQRVVAPPADQQKYAGSHSYGGYGGGAWGGGEGAAGLEEAKETLNIPAAQGNLKKIIQTYNQLSEEEQSQLHAFLAGARGDNE